MKRAVAIVAACMASAALGQTVLWDNGPIVTNPTGGTGAIAGQPISNADGFTFPGQSFIFSTTGVGAATWYDNALAEDFTVPEGEEWELTEATFFAFLTPTNADPIRAVRLNLWTSTPYNAHSPSPVPFPLPQPMLPQPLEVATEQGPLVCHRQSVTSTSTVRPVHEYTVSLDGLVPGGRLGPGTYWLEFAFVNDLTVGQNVLVPLVTPRDAVEGHNARQYNAIDGQMTSPRAWFEGREGYVNDEIPGRAFELPFVLRGRRVPLCGTSDFDGDGDAGTDADIEAFFACLAGACCASCWHLGADFDGDGDAGTDADIEAFFRVLAGGSC
jgi:hypothetical protein